MIAVLRQNLGLLFVSLAASALTHGVPQSLLAHHPGLGGRHALALILLAGTLCNLLGIGASARWPGSAQTRNVGIALLGLASTALLQLDGLWLFGVAYGVVRFGLGLVGTNVDVAAARNAGAGSQASNDKAATLLRVVGMLAGILAVGELGVGGLATTLLGTSSAAALLGSGWRLRASDPLAVPAQTARPTAQLAAQRTAPLAVSADVTREATLLAADQITGDRLTGDRTTADRTTTDRTTADRTTADRTTADRTTADRGTAQRDARVDQLVFAAGFCSYAGFYVGAATLASTLAPHVGAGEAVTAANRSIAVVFAAAATLVLAAPGRGALPAARLLPSTAMLALLAISLDGAAPGVPSVRLLASAAFGLSFGLLLLALREVATERPAEERDTWLRRLNRLPDLAGAVGFAVLFVAQVAVNARTSEVIAAFAIGAGASATAALALRRRHGATAQA